MMMMMTLVMKTMMNGAVVVVVGGVIAHTRPKVPLAILWKKWQDLIRYGIQDLNTILTNYLIRSYI